MSRYIHTLLARWLDLRRVDPDVLRLMKAELNQFNARSREEKP